MSDKKSDQEKLKTLIEYWISHNKEHIEENKKWMLKAESAGFEGVRESLEHVIELSGEINNQLEIALSSMGKYMDGSEKEEKVHSVIPHIHIQLHPIGIIRSPFIKEVPRGIDMDEVECTIIVDPEWKDGLFKLDSFSHIYVIFFFHMRTEEPIMVVHPPWAGGVRVGVFASRSPVRPNSIGLSIVKLKRIEGNEIYTSGFDVLDGTPVLDIKPYIGSRDSKAGASNGWLADLD